VTSLEDLEPGPVAGPTPMRRAHANGLRKAVAMIRAWLEPEHREHADSVVNTVLRLHLQEWAKVYHEGVEVLALSQTERTVMVIREDTVRQILAELG
jgi:hypothetical protein